MSAVIFKDCTEFDGTSADLREGMSVVVENDRIREVADRQVSVEGARVIEAKGKTLMPGLIDAHFHAIAADPDLGKLENMPKMLLAQHARRFLEAALHRGFTSLRDAGGADYGLALATEHGLIAGPRLFFAGRALTQTGGHGDFRSYEDGSSLSLCLCCRGGAALAQVADGVTEVRKAAREELRRGATQIKIMASGGVASPSDPIDNLQYSDEEIAAAVWEAQSWGRYVMAHAYTPQSITRCLNHGVRSIEHANLIDEATAKLAAEKEAFVVPTLVTYDALNRFGAGLGFPQVSLDKLQVVLSAGLKSLEVLRRAGVRTGFGTDLLGDMHQHQSSEFSIRREVMSAAEILISATSVNAALVQKEGELGVVRAGALADLLLVDGNPLDDINLLEHHGRNLAIVMKNGRIYKDALAA